MKFISWNVNGLRAVLNKGFEDFFYKVDADIFCVQETKMQEGQADLTQAGYYQFMSSAIKKGYSGTLVYSKERPNNVIYGIHPPFLFSIISTVGIAIGIFISCNFFISFNFAHSFTAISMFSPDNKP